MRTTLTLDPDVAAELKRLLRKENRNLKALVNELLRLGLRQRSETRAEEPGYFRTQVVDLGAPFIDLVNVAEVLALTEGENHK